MSGDQESVSTKGSRSKHECDKHSVIKPYLCWDAAFALSALAVNVLWVPPRANQRTQWFGVHSVLTLESQETAATHTQA